MESLKGNRQYRRKMASLDAHSKQRKRLQGAEKDLDKRAELRQMKVQNKIQKAKFGCEIRHKDNKDYLVRVKIGKVGRLAILIVGGKLNRKIMVNRNVQTDELKEARKIAKKL